MKPKHQPDTDDIRDYYRHRLENELGISSSLNIINMMRLVKRREIENADNFNDFGSLLRFRFWNRRSKEAV